MKAKYIFIALVLLSLSILNTQRSTAHAQGTAFTYQGQLQNNGSPASGTYNLTFALFNTNATGIPISGPVTNNAVIVSNGLFTVQIDFGSTAFIGQSNWLEIAVETNLAGNFNTLAPRQELTPAPYAIYAEGAGILSGTITGPQLTSVGNSNGGSGNFFVGLSGNSTTSGSNNTANGQTALLDNTTGNNNTANGASALQLNTTGSDNTANGEAALANNTSGNNNTANGYQSLISNQTGSYNTANGFNSLFSNLSGSNNVADGRGALFSNSISSFNTAVGVEALNDNSSGFNNIALGYRAGYDITTGSSNIDIGNQGVSTDTNIIRIGSAQSQTFIAGVINGNGGGLTNVPGTLIWQTVSGSSVQALSNYGYLLTNGQTVTVTLPISPNPGDIVRVSGGGSGGWRIAQNNGQSILSANFTGVSIANSNWAVTSAPFTNWSAVASSSDGSKLVAVNNSGPIYISTNSGVTWSDNNNSLNEQWVAVASSADGSKLVAASIGAIYTSTNSGATWTSRVGGTTWTSVASSADGTKMAAVNSSGQIYGSSDSGTTWSAASGAPSHAWQSVALPAAGFPPLLAVASDGYVATTADMLTWTTSFYSGVDWKCVASSSSGAFSVAVATVTSGHIYTGAAATFTDVNNAPAGYWLSVACSVDGSRIVAGGQNGLYASTDSGHTWTQGNAPSQTYQSVASSTDGSHLVAAGGGYLYTAQATSTNVTTSIGVAGYLTGGQNSSVELQYLGNGQFIPISHEGTVFPF
jgi:photosystem II stability/assembly factor-like uncharacterized protein